MNNVQLVGRITKDLELRKSNNGNSYLFFTVAVDEKRSNGEKLTNFIPCTAFGKTAENMDRFLKKGSLISVEGSIGVRNNQTDGKYETIVNVSANRVHFLEPKNSNASQPNTTVTTSQIAEDIIIADDDSVLWD